MASRMIASADIISLISGRKPTPPFLAIPAVSATPPILTLSLTTTPSMATPVVVGATNAAFKYTGFSIAAWGPNPAYQASSNVAINNYVEFWSDSGKLDLILVRYNTQVDLLVDNVRVQSANKTTDAVGSGCILTIDWSGVQKPRHYRIGGFNFPFGGVNLGPNDSVWYPAERKAPLIAFLADSYGLGTGASQIYISRYHVAANLLGMEPFVDGVSGAGWLTTGAGLPATRVANEIAPLSVAPGVIVTCLGYNDKGGNMTTLTTNYNAAIAALKTAWPSARLITLGPHYPVGPDGTITTVENTLVTAAASQGVSFISQAGWINASNKSVYTGGDLVHPTDLGYSFLGARDAQQILAII